MSRKKVSTTIYITPEQADRLKLLHERTKVPIAVFIREGIDMMLKHYEHVLPGQMSLDNASLSPASSPSPAAAPSAASAGASRREPVAGLSHEASKPLARDPAVTLRTGAAGNESPPDRAFGAGSPHPPKAPSSQAGRSRSGEGGG